MKTLKIRNIEINKGIPKICVSLMGKTISDLKSNYEVIKGYCFDIVEWRIDYFEEIENLNKVKEASSLLRELFHDIPLIYTFRNYKEGGIKEISEEYYEVLLKTIIDEHCCDIIDIEYAHSKSETLLEYAKEKEIALILSYHNFNETFEKIEIIKLFERMIEKNPDICKMALMPKNEKDVFNMINATQYIRDHYDTILISLSMGEIGKVTRIMSEVIGSAITFGYIGNTSAPGQIEVDELRKMLLSLHKQES